MKTRKNIIYSLVIITSLMPYLYVFYDFGKIKFGIDHYVGFYPIFGFIACLFLIIIAKLIGVFLKREDTFYDE